MEFIFHTISGSHTPFSGEMIMSKHRILHKHAWDFSCRCFSAVDPLSLVQLTEDKSTCIHSDKWLTFLRPLWTLTFLQKIFNNSNNGNLGQEENCGIQMRTFFLPDIDSIEKTQKKKRKKVQLLKKKNQTNKGRAWDKKLQSGENNSSTTMRI